MEHSRVGASSMSRWSVCPGSVAHLERHPKGESMAASEGTLAHDMAEKKLNALFNGTEVPKCLDPDMEDHVNYYVDYCWKLTEQNKGYSVEQRFTLDHIRGDVFGTNDFSCWTDMEILHIVDLKYGKGKVYAKENKQLFYYALGAIHQNKLDPYLVYFHIVQPRVSPRFNVWETSIGRILQFSQELRTAVTRVDEEPELRVPGSHCYFCNHRKCPEYNEAGKAAQGMTEPEDLITIV
jgi:hypothetical protein